MSRGGRHSLPSEQRGSPFRDALRDRTFRVLFLAESQSLIGDQVARVALAILVFQRTDSEAATALAYACTFLPALIGGAWLARLGDRWSRRTVMVACDLTRAGLFALMSVSNMPLPAVFGLLVAAIMIGPAFSAAEVSTLAAVLDGNLFRSATGLRMMTNQLSQVGGFLVGGAIVAVIHPHGALLVDAASYAISALLVAMLVPSTRGRGDEDHLSGPRVRSSMRWLWRRPPLRSLLALGWLAAFFVVPEGLAVPLAERHGASSATVGVLLAAIPLGSALGAFAMVRWVRPGARATAMRWLAPVTGLPLLATAVNPPLAVTAVLWGVSGFCAAYQVEVLTMLLHRVPDERRATITGFVGAGLTGVQGLGLIGFGLIAQATGPGVGVALAGATGSLLALLLVVRASLPVSDERVGDGSEPVRHTRHDPAAPANAHSSAASRAENGIRRYGATH